MIRIASAKAINLQCTEPSIAEFPDLLFGTTSERRIYFDADAYLQTHSPVKSVQDFFKDYAAPIQQLQILWNMKDTDVYKLNTQGHILIDSNLVYLFISFVEPEFLAYMLECMDTLLADGVVITDANIVKAARRRLDAESIKAMIEDEAPE